MIPGVGAPVGSLVGLLLGMVVQQQIDQVTETHERKDLAQQLTPEAAPPAATVSLAGLPRPMGRGEPMRVWVDERVDRGRVLAGHFEARHLN